jgi:hypothetical protein
MNTDTPSLGAINLAHAASTNKKIKKIKKALRPYTSNALNATESSTKAPYSLILIINNNQHVKKRCSDLSLTSVHHPSRELPIEPRRTVCSLEFPSMLPIPHPGR